MSPAGRRFVEVGVMLVAAACEVGGDALIRSGLRGRGWIVIALGALTLSAYGVIVNLLPVDFSKMLGTYVGFFAMISILFGRIAFRESVPASTWVGLAVILTGSVIIQLGGR